MSKTGAEAALLLVLVQIVLIIAASRVFGSLGRRIGQAQVCGEIAAGLVLGPSLLGRVAPQIFSSIFPPASTPVLSIISQIGLVLLMFLIGLEFDFGHMAENKRTTASISIAGILLPFGLGLLLGQWIHRELQLDGSSLNFSLFVATAMSITAIPILGRIMLDLNLNRTRIGAITISAAAMDDVCGWTILAIVTAIARSALDSGRLVVMLAAIVAYGTCMIWLVRPILKRWVAGVMRRSDGLSAGPFALLLIMVFLSAVVTNEIGIFSIFGAFVFGAVLYDEDSFRKAVRERMAEFIGVFFLPIFFTYTGLRTDVGTMAGGKLWTMCALVLLTAVTGKFGGCALAARFGGLSWRQSSIVGVMMNTRALMELIVINVGYDLGIIPKSVFFMLVLMAVVTTFMTMPALKALLRPGDCVSGEARLAAAK